MILSEAIDFDHSKIGSYCEGFVAIEHRTALSMPALSIEASSDDTLPSCHVFISISAVSAAIALGASLSGNACV
jgi:hypothetical protein